VPAGSLPDDEAALAALAGMEIEYWTWVREQALHGFARHSDGRLYDPCVVIQALDALAWVAKVERRKADDRRRHREFHARKKGPAER
jgi:hypothetical protein